MLRKLDEILEKIENIVLIITGISVCVLIFVGAILRYVLKIDFYGSEEIILFMAFWLYFMGSSLAAKKQSHINANMLTIFIKNEKTLLICDLLKNLIALFITICVTNWCYKYVSWSAQMGAVSNVFKLPNIIGQIPIFISFLLWNIYLIRDIIMDYKKIKNFS